MHTVEVHLSHAYAKLGVRSRAQLARRLSERSVAAAKIVGFRYFAEAVFAVAWLGMNEFLVELYVSKTNCEPSRVACGAPHARGRGADRRGQTGPLVRSIFVPEDETCFLLVEAATAEAVRETARRAAVRYERVAETSADLDEAPSPRGAHPMNGPITPAQKRRRALALSALAAVFLAASLGPAGEATAAYKAQVDAGR